MVTKNELIEYISPLLKEYGFKKKGSAWLKTTESFTYRFYIQGSVYGSDQYYIRPGIIINSIPSDGIKYGHISADIAVTTKEEIWSKTQEFYSQWHSIEYLKTLVLDFIEWEKRNPVEKRRNGLVNYIEDPVPSEYLFAVSERTKKAILEL